MSAGRRVVLGAAVATSAAVVSLAASIVLNYLPEDAPGWLRPPWIWVSLGVLAGLAAVLAAIAVVQGRRGDNPDLPAPSQRSPVLGPAKGIPNSLRPPRPGTSVRGRTDPLARLDAAIAEPDGRFVVICAIGGVGKTTLAAEAARRAEQAGRRVFWISWHHDPETLAAQLVETALALGLPATRVQAAHQSGAGLPDLIWDHLAGVRGWVLVIDNLDEPAALRATGERLADYRGWIRPGGGGLLLVTSRDRERSTWGERAQLLTLDPLTAEDGAVQRSPIPRCVITPSLLTAVTAEPVSEEVVDRTLTGLHRYGLIDVPDTTRTHGVRTVTMHRLVRETNVELLARSTEVALWRDAVSQQLIRQVNDTASTGQAGWSTARLLAPHLPLLTGLGNATISAFIPARDLTATENHCGPDHPETVRSRYNLPACCRR
ncbi:MAG: AAA family ATPase [Pseudonocardiaceae bacterium]